MTTSDVQIEWTLPAAARRGRKARRSTKSNGPSGRIPRISRLMALAIKLDGLIREGAIRDYADIARLGFITRARATQIMALTNLTPDLQEHLLLLPPTTDRPAVTERQLRYVVAEPYWPEQRRLLRKLLAPTSPPTNLRKREGSPAA